MRKLKTSVEIYVDERCKQLGIKLSDLRSDIPFPHPSGIKDADKASDIIVDVIVNGDGMIVLNTDYDLDGISSGAIGYSALVYGCGVPTERVEILQNQRNLGNGFNDSALNRMIEGYQLPIDIMITSDHGSSDELRYVKLKESVGCKIVVTDHHLFKRKPVTVDAFVNTQQEGDTYSKNISGGVTIWMVMMLVKEKLSKLGESTKYKINEKRFNAIYPLAALTTVCDQMDMTDNTNRYIVVEGLKFLNESQDMRWQEVRRFFKNKEITSTDLAFRFGPIINSTGRLLDAEAGTAFLVENIDSRRCRDRFEKALDINDERKALTTEAERIVKGQYAKDKKYDSIITIAVEEKIGGLAGPIASGFVDREHKPTLILYTDSDTVVKGSGRSIDGVHLERILAKVKEIIPDILLYAEGHAGAVGVAVHKDGLEEFKHVFNETVNKSVKVFKDKEIDIIKSNNVTLELYEDIQSLGPFGRRWKEPAIAINDATLISVNTDRKKLHAFLSIRTNTGIVLEGFRFKGHDPFFREGMKVDIQGALSHKGKGKMSLFIHSMDEVMPF